MMWESSIVVHSIRGIYGNTLTANDGQGGVCYVTYGTFLFLQTLTNSGVTQDSRPLAEAMRQAFQQDWQPWQRIPAK